MSDVTPPPTAELRMQLRSSSRNGGQNLAPEVGGKFVNERHRTPAGLMAAASAPAGVAVD